MTLSATIRKYGPEQSVMLAGAILAYSYWNDKGDTWDDWSWGEVIVLYFIVFAVNFVIREGSLLKLPTVGTRR